MTMSHCPGASNVASNDEVSKILNVVSHVSSKMPVLTAGACDQNAMNQYMQAEGAMKLMPCYTQNGCMGKSGTAQMCCSLACTIPVLKTKLPACAAQDEMMMTMSHCPGASNVASNDEVSKILNVVSHVSSKMPVLTAGACDQNAMNQ